MSFQYQEPLHYTYRFSRPKAVRDMMDMVGYRDETTGAQVTSQQLKAVRARQLAGMGYSIDYEIDVLGSGDSLHNSFESVMTTRQNAGLLWVPPVGTQVEHPDSQTDIPEGMIPITLDPAAYPLHADLIVRVKPFDWPTYAYGKDAQGNPLDIGYLESGALWMPHELSDIGAKYAPDSGPDAGKAWRKVFFAMQKGNREILWQRVK